MDREQDFKALVVERSDDGSVHADIRHLHEGNLPLGDVTLDVKYSSVNYKDGLAVTGKGNVLRSYPMVPGIDLAGVVAGSSSPACNYGQEVIVTGWGIGEDHWGGYSQRNRVNSEWALPVPPGMTMKNAMSVGTAGLTAMLCAMAIRDNGVNPDSGDILVTGASGGVGSIAVLILSQIGYRVVASTGRAELTDYLKSLGASDVIGRDELLNFTDKPLVTPRWAGVVDAVGGATLASALKAVQTWGVVAQCGVAGGTELNTSVLPFTLRGVSLIGIHCSETPTYRRMAAWNLIARDINPDDLDRITKTISLEQVPRTSTEILAARIQGRTVVDLNL